MSAERAFAAAVRARLAGDAGVRAVLGDEPRLYDEAPDDAVFPYVTLGAVQVRAADVSESAALEHQMTLHIWSRYGGRGEALDIIGALRAALHDTPLAVAGRRLIYLFAPFADVFRSGDARTTHGVLRLRALTEPL